MQGKSPQPPALAALFLAGLLVLLAAAACKPAAPRFGSSARSAALLPARTVVIAASATPALFVTPATSDSLAFTPTWTAAPTQTPLPAWTPTATPIPTYAILRGEVLVRSNCRYGPGEPYMYKYGLVVGSNLEVIGRNDLGTWILVRAIGGDNPCWVKASLMDVKGDVMSVAPTDLPLPISPYYRPPSAASAVREGDEVSVFWNPITLNAGDDSGHYPYVVEAWVCRAGELVFTPVGSYEAAVKIVDEEGCSEASHGQVRAAEKHGYTRAVEIPWPAHPAVDRPAALP